MFECVIKLVVPMTPLDASGEKYQTWEIAKYNFDPGLQLNDEIFLTNLKIGDWQDPPFNFSAGVTRCQKQILLDKEVEKSIFRVLITVEVKDKDEFPRFIEIMKKLNPDKFKN